MMTNQVKVRYTGGSHVIVTPPPDTDGKPRPQFVLGCNNAEVEVDIDIAADLCRRPDVEAATKPADKAIAAYWTAIGQWLAAVDTAAGTETETGGAAAGDDPSTGEGPS